MTKYVDYDIVFQEVPGEVSLALNISNCPFNCEGCHSPHLRENIGRNVLEDLPILLKKYEGMITCVLFLGTGTDIGSFHQCVDLCKNHGLKVAIYTGDDLEDIHHDELSLFWFAGYYHLPDYLKIGPYKKELGGLSSPSTNQRMYRWNAQTYGYDDITSMFWNKGVND